MGGSFYAMHAVSFFSSSVVNLLMFVRVTLTATLLVAERSKKEYIDMLCDKTMNTSSNKDESSRREGDDGGDCANFLMWIFMK